MKNYYNRKISYNGIISNKMYFLFLIVFTMIYSIGIMANIDSLFIFAFVCLSAIIILSNVNQLYYSFVFFAPMFLYIVVGTFPLYNVIIVMLFIKKILEKKTRLNNVHIILFILIISLELSHFLIMGKSPSLNLIKFFMIVFLASLHLYDCQSDFSTKTAVKYLFYGTLIYSVVFLIENNGLLINDSSRIGGLGELDPNTYGLYTLFAFSIFYHQFLSGKYNKKQSVIMGIGGIVILGAGLLTLSKTYLISIILLFSLLLIGSQMKPKKILKLILIITCGLIFITRIPLFIESIQSILYRIEMGKVGGDITTGRTIIISRYIDYFFSNIKTFFVGDGMYSYMSIFTIRPHNSILELLISWGIIGTIIFITMFGKGTLVYRRKHKRNSTIKFYKLIPLIIFLFYSQSLTLMYQEATYAYIIVALMLAVDRGEKEISSGG